MSKLKTQFPGMNSKINRYHYSSMTAILGMILMIFLAACGANNTTILKASGLQFSETELRAQVGQPVSLELFNTDGYAHAFDIDEFNIHIEMPASKTIPLTFTPGEPGTYMFYCGAYGHKGAGMVGMLVVEP
jgi:heme/copper-type cytochrome/quinol oxidase subunit 2